MSSYIQDLILAKLLTSEKGLPYSKARPGDTDNDLFNYHLQFLVGKHYIKKIDDKYSLTKKGKKHVLQMDMLGKTYEYFKASVLTYVVKQPERKILLHKRLRHPYYGDIMTVSGKVLPGEKIETAAKKS